MLVSPAADFILFGAFAAALCWYFAGYILGLALLRRLRPRGMRLEVPDVRDPDLPDVTVLVPVFNEAELVEDKIANLLVLEYPRPRLRIVVVDGGSSDATLRKVESATREPAAQGIVSLLPARSAGKIPQLNEALATVPASHLVVVTDADARIERPDALLRTVGYFRSNPGVGLVGGWVSPVAGHDLALHAEHAYWDKQNRLRYAETVAFSASIVVAPFYAFFRDGLREFPEDCIADDVYISFASHIRGKRVLYAPDIPVVELRQPSGLAALYRHKRRKAHAYALELLRVAYKVPEMGKRLKYFYAHKLFEFFYLPWAALGLGLLTLRLLYLGYPGVVSAAYAALAATVLLASLSMTPPSGRTRGGLGIASAASSAVIFAVMFAVLMANFFFFPFRKQDSSYARLASPGAGS